MVGYNKTEIFDRNSDLFIETCEEKIKLRFHRQVVYID